MKRNVHDVHIKAEGFKCDRNGSHWGGHPDLQHVCTLIFMTLCSLSTFSDADCHHLNLSSLNLSHQNASSLHVDVVRSQNKRLTKSIKTEGDLLKELALLVGNQCTVPLYMINREGAKLSASIKQYNCRLATERSIIGKA